MASVTDEQEAIDAAEAAIQKVERVGRGARVTLANGIVLECKPIQPLLVQTINQDFDDRMPKVPLFYDEAKDREIENPSDPSYIMAVMHNEGLREMAITDLVLAIGTHVSVVPEELHGPEDDDWIDEVEMAFALAGQEMKVSREEPRKRYLQWLRFYAIDNASDLAIIGNLPIELAGISEAEVSSALNSFRGLPQPGADSGLPTPAVGTDGDRSNRAARRTRPAARRT